jgi:hypothetical protein
METLLEIGQMMDESLHARTLLHAGITLGLDPKHLVMISARVFAMGVLAEKNRATAAAERAILQDRLEGVN